MTSDESGRTRDLTPLSDVLDGLVGELLARSGGEASHIIFGEWDEICDDTWARARPIRLDGTTLVVEAATPALATRLRYATSDLLSSLTERVGAGRVTDVRVKVARRRPGAG